MQLGRDVGERDAAVGEVNAAQTGADDVVVQPRDEVVGAVGAELGAVGLGNLGEAAGRDRAAWVSQARGSGGRVGPQVTQAMTEVRVTAALLAASRRGLSSILSTPSCRGPAPPPTHLVEGDEVPTAYRLRELQVRLQRLAQARQRKLLALGHLAQQQAHQDEPLAGGYAEAERRRRGLAHSLATHSRGGGGVVKLTQSNSSKRCCVTRFAHEERRGGAQGLTVAACPAPAPPPSYPQHPLPLPRTCCRLSFASVYSS